MSDPRREKLAQILVNYSLGVKPDEWILVKGHWIAEPLIAEVVKEIVRAGAHPTVELDSERVEEAILGNANEEQLKWVSPLYVQAIENAQGLIYILANQNTRHLSSIPPEKQRIQAVAMHEKSLKGFARQQTGEFRFSGTQYPCQAFAQEASMSLTEFEDFAYSAAYANRDDPIGEWSKLHDRQQHLVDWLAGKKEVVIHSPDADVRFSIEGRTFINSDGKYNMPSGEIYTGPVEDSVEGTVLFSFPGITNGKEVEGIRLEFRKGKVVKATALKNEPFLLEMLEVDEGARYLGEFGIGTNYGITRFTKSMLYDEKMGGTIHLALGGGYPESGSKNESSIHWDLLCDMRQDSEIRVDGELFYKDGKILIGDY
jgi:aminopeptidase